MVKTQEVTRVRCLFQSKEGSEVTRSRRCRDPFGHSTGREIALEGSAQAGKPNSF